jgi:signal transduction histidine kinase
MPGEPEADRQLRALVALIEGQAEQLATLRRTVADLSGRLAIRSDLDALVAGELEGPMSELHELLESLRGNPPDSERLLDEADRQVRHLRSVASDLRGPDGWSGPPVARIRLRRMDVADVVQRAVQLGHLGALVSRLTVHVEPGLNLTTSSPRLIAMLVNLVDRATRRSPEGGAVLRAWTLQPGLVRFEVCDRGPGLAADDLEAAFAYQGLRDRLADQLAGQRNDQAGDQASPRPDMPADRQPDPHPADSGDPDRRALGLHLVRLLARSLGGDAWVSNGPAGGTVVTVDLPQRRQED